MSTVLSFTAVITLVHANAPAAENGEYSCFVALRKNHTIQRSTKCTKCDCDTLVLDTKFYSHVRTANFRASEANST